MIIGENIKINSTSAVTYFEYGKDLMNTNCGRWYQGQKVDNKVKGKFSKKSKKRFSEVIKNWISVIDSNLELKENKNKTYSNYLRFVTLTLSAEQFHDDKFIRRYLLNDFLRTIKVKHKVKSYLYCSEAQQNGNIHFHIVIDKNIHYKQIRNIWNRIQAAHGYINKFEKKHGHRDPNSTDIHSFKKINSVAAYLIKYFTKDESRRLITGRLWGCSDNLRNLECFVTEIDFEFGEFLNQYVETVKPDIFKHDFFSFFRQIKWGEIKKINVNIYNRILQFYIKQTSLL